ncbi:MAG TPA: radical SAM family heme chaperone HemW [Terriglobales bacterium]|nr:radical SAM family heme chaperone HemW [Terriglobales bacterium]
MALGLYISVPFCRTKCTYCNFASGVFSRWLFTRYIDRVCRDIADASHLAPALGGRFDRAVDSIYLGGGTPSLLDVAQLERLFVTIQQNFHCDPAAEVTVECAPGTLSGDFIDALCRCGVNRVSLGVQSFVDREAAAIGRLHTQATVFKDIERLRSAGLTNINVDLIAGLPHQSSESWAYSLQQAIATGAPHVSVYMLEVDEDSRLGRELIAGGTKYLAHHVPDQDAIADFYLAACEALNAAGLGQYEISNFARSGFESRHNLKYWTRQPYLGFGVDAHSMLYADAVSQRADSGANREDRTTAVRFSTPESLEDFTAGAPPSRIPVSYRASLEETLFLGLRLNRGVDLGVIEQGSALQADYGSLFAECADAGLLERHGTSIRLTQLGRLLSNEVFERVLSRDHVPVAPDATAHDDGAHDRAPSLHASR